MRLDRWLRPRTRSPHAPARRPAPVGRPEVLEDRTAPAVDVQFDPGTGELTIDMDGPTDAVAISTSVSQSNDITVDATGQTYTDVDSVVVTGNAVGQTLRIQGDALIQVAGRITSVGVGTVQVDARFFAEGGFSFTGANTVGIAAIVAADGPVVITAVSLINLIGGSIFSNTSPQTLTVMEGGVSTDAAGTDLTSPDITVNAGQPIGSPGLNPLRVTGNTLTANTAATGVSQYFGIGSSFGGGSGSTGPLGVDAGMGTVHLTEGGFALLDGDVGIGNTTTLDLAELTFLDLLGNGETIGGLTGTGTVANFGAAPAALTVGSGGIDSTFAGTLQDGGAALSLVKVGAGTLTLAATASVGHTGTTTVADGVLVLDATNATSDVAVTGTGVLTGTGTVEGKLVTVRGGGALRPGGTPVSGTFAATDVTFEPGAAFLVGVAFQTGFEPTSNLLEATGAVDLGGAELRIDAFTLAGESFGSTKIIQAGQVTGTFNNLPDGAVLTAFGRRFRVNYGADVVTLTAVPDTTAPTATVAAADVTDGNAPSPYTFTVTYTDEFDVDAATFGNGNVTVTGPAGVPAVAVEFVSATPTGNGTPRTATYRFAPPGGFWDSTDNGAYTVAVGTAQVADGVGNVLPVGVQLGGFTVTLTADTTPPTAVLTAVAVTDASQPNPYRFTVTYTDTTAVAAATFADGNVTVSDPTGAAIAVTLVSVDVPGDGSPRTATYQITPPGGAWDSADNGTYAVRIGTAPVADAGGNAIAAGTQLGTFAVTITPPPPPPPPDTTPPTAAATVGNVAPPAPPPPYSFQVVYSDPSGFAPGTFAAGNVRVTGPGGFVVDPTPVVVSPSADGLTVVATYTFTPPGGTWDSADNGTYTVAVGPLPVADGAGNPVAPGTGLANFTVTIPPPVVPPVPPVVPPVVPPLPPLPPLVVGGAGDGSALAYTPDGAGGYGPAAPLPHPFAGQGVLVRTAVADVDGDGFADTVLTTGPGVQGLYAIVSGRDGRVLVPPTDPIGVDPLFGPFTAGLYVAAGDLDGDGRAEWVISPEDLGGPRTIIFSLVGGTPTLVSNFFGISDSAFRGGQRTALGDVNGDGFLDVICIAAAKGGPRLAIFDGRQVVAVGLRDTPPKLLANDIFVADPASRAGLFIGSGDVNGDGFADILATNDPTLGNGSQVRALSGFDLANQNPTPALLADFVATGIDPAGGLRVGTTDADRDALADVAVGSGAGQPGRIKVYRGRDITPSGEPASLELDPFGGAILTDGVFIG